MTTGGAYTSIRIYLLWLILLQLWEFAAHLFPQQKAAMDSIREDQDLPDIPLATPPALVTAKGGGVKVIQYIDKIQKYLLKLTYNHTGIQYCR